jgi:arylsulfatase A-like enzyme
MIRLNRRDWMKLGAAGWVATAFSGLSAAEEDQRKDGFLQPADTALTFPFDTRRCHEKPAPWLPCLVGCSAGWWSCLCGGSTEYHPDPGRRLGLGRFGMLRPDVFRNASSGSPGSRRRAIHLGLCRQLRLFADSVQHQVTGMTGQETSGRVPAEALKHGGYATGHVGKWHLGAEPYYPEHQGFDMNIAGTRAGSPAGGYYLPNKMNLDDMQPGDYLTDRLTDECLRLIDNWQDRPFFIYLAYHTVHTPIQGRQDLVEYYRGKLKPDETHNCHYAAMVHCLDENVGRILSRLEERKLDQRTIVVFTSDNGGFSHSGGRKNDVTTNEPLRLGKGYCYEGGHRVATIIRYPNVTGQDGVCDVPVVSTDFYPTLLELAGLPLRPEQHVDGVSLAPLLADPEHGKIERDAIYWHYPHDSPQGGTPSGAIRQGDWKLIEFFGDGRLELYNLNQDLSEADDLAQHMPERVEQLHEELKAWRQAVDAKMPPPMGR